MIYGCFVTHLVLPNTEVLARVKRTYSCLQFMRKKVTKILIETANKKISNFFVNKFNDKSNIFKCINCNNNIFAKKAFNRYAVFQIGTSDGLPACKCII